MEAIKVLQVETKHLEELAKLIKEKDLSADDLNLILETSRLKTITTDEHAGTVFLRESYDRYFHAEDLKDYLERLDKNSERLAGIAFEAI